MTTSSELRLLAVEGLMGKTLAGTRVYSARTMATWKGEYPMLYLHSPIEDMESLGRNGGPQFTVTSTLAISARVQEKNLPRNGGAALVLLDLETIQQQIKMALINYPPLMSRLQQYPFIRSEMHESGEGESDLGELVMQIGMEFYQGPEDFYPFTPDTLEQVNVTADLLNVFDGNGTYPDAPFPDAVQPAPRNSGPDGRAEGELTFVFPPAE
jgi:hypothetical protein